MAFTISNFTSEATGVQVTFDRIQDDAGRCEAYRIMQSDVEAGLMIEVRKFSVTCLNNPASEMEAYYKAAAYFSKVICAN